MNADGTGITRVTNSAGWNDEPAWSPDGTQLLYESQENGNADINRILPDGNGNVTLTTSSADDRFPDWQPIVQAPAGVFTNLHGGGQDGDNISVPPNTPVTDTAFLSGPHAGTASGTVTYTVYADSSCASPIADAGTVTVTDGAVPESGPVSLATPGVYYWRAFYSGDFGNSAGSNTCGSEIEEVTEGPATGLTVTSEWSPAASDLGPRFGRVNKGDEALWSAEVTNHDGESGVGDVVVQFTIADGSFDLTAVKALNPDTACKKSSPGIGVECTVASIPPAASVTVKAIVDTTDVSVGSNPVLLTTVVSASSGEATSSDETKLFVDPASTDISTGYVPPGETIDAGPGPKDLSSTEPVNGIVKLPKKITPGTASAAAAAAKPKPVPGPGASLTVSIDDPSQHPAACGGSNPPCLGKVLSITNPDDSSCALPPCPILPGYTDPKKPVLVTVDWFGGTFPPNSTLYIVKDGSTTAVPIPKCTKSHGAYINTPCVKKHTVKKKTGQITDVIALLFGDPIIRR